MADLSLVAPSPGRAALDILVRAVKTAVSTFIGILGANVAGWTNIAGVKNAGIVALAEQESWARLGAKYAALYRSLL